MKSGLRHYLILLFILLGAFFVRTFRTDDLLRFYYDQGRDAQIVQRVINEHRPVLVGPTTGLAGILRGPAYYYLVLPGYLIGHGSPVTAAIWLQAINVIGLIFIYLCGRQLFGPRAGLIAVLIASFSYRFVDLSRWLSNPSPILTSVPFMLYGLIQITKNNKPNFWWPVVFLILGINLQLEIASEFWFIPAVFLFWLFFPQYRPKKNTAVISVALFFVTLLPQIIFDFRHEGLLRQAIIQNFASSANPSFSYSPQLFNERWNFYLQSFAEIFYPNQIWMVIALLLASVPLLTFYRPFQSNGVKLLMILIITPLVILAFYSGNYGNFYSYYLMGLLPLFVIFSAGVLSSYVPSPRTWIFVALFLFIFLSNNHLSLYNFFQIRPTNPEHISLGTQKLAIDWIYQQANNQPFNLNVYVPPVIPYAYDYLFKWYGENKYHQLPSSDKQTLIFTLSEADTIRPEVFADWQKQQDSISRVENKVEFGDIQVQQRRRL